MEIFPGARKTTAKILSVGLIVLMLGTLAAPAMAATAQDNEIHVTKLIVEPSGPDLHFTVYYESNFFTRFFSIIFGAKVLQPDIERVFANFSNVSVTSLDANNKVAKLVVRNVATLDKNGWYVYNGDKTFTTKIDVIEIHNPDGQVVTLKGTNKLPAISNRMPTLGKK